MSQPEINAEQFVDAEAVRGRSGDRKALREEGARFYQRVLDGAPEKERVLYVHNGSDLYTHALETTERMQLVQDYGDILQGIRNAAEASRDVITIKYVSSVLRNLPTQ